MCCVLIDIHVLLFHFFTLSLSPQEYFLTLVPSLFSFYLVLLVAPGPAAINLLMMQQHTYFICSHAFSLDLSHTFLSLSRTQSIVSLSLARLSLLIVYFLSFSLARSPYTHDAHFFYMCVCSLFSFFHHFVCVCLCSSFIDYLNVTTKLDISTSSNKLGFVFLMCVFPFILNISLLFFKRLKLRIFFRVSIARFFFLLQLLFYFFFSLF